MTDNELQELYDIGEDEYPVCLKAWEQIEWLEEQMCNLVAYIEDLKDSHAKLYVSRKMDGPL